MDTFKFYELGVVCGRFGHEHLGHVSLFDASMKFCKKTLILVGSAQESGTLRNPFTLQTRIDMIRETYPNESDDTLMIRGINDTTNEYDISFDWGKYVKSEVIRHSGKFADFMVYGNDEMRSKWFSPDDLSNTAQFIVPRNNISASATMIRGLLVINDKSCWQKLTSPLIHKFYYQLRDELMNSSAYQYIYNSISNSNMSLDDFMKVYKVLEEEDKKFKLNEILKLRK